MSPCECVVVLQPSKRLQSSPAGSQRRIERLENFEVFSILARCSFQLPGPWGPGASLATPGLPVLSAPLPAIRRDKIVANRSTDRPADPLTPP
jgi:hypothetical protein